MLSTAEAADVLQTSERMVHYFVRAGRLKPAKTIGRSYLFDPNDVADLKPTMVRRNWSRQLPASSDAGHINLDKALLFLGGCALGVIGSLSPLDVTVTVALVAVCTYAAAWLVGHELFERRERRNRRDQVIEEAVCRRLDVELLDHVIVPGRFSQIGTRK